jgi:sulfate adenylyltransferase
MKWSERMQDLIPPHGGLKEPVNRMTPVEEAADFRRQAATLKRVPISDADLSSLYRMGDGGLSPLTGPMHKKAFEQALEDELLVHGGKAYAWTIPIAFPADRELAGSLKIGENMALLNGREEIVGTLRVEDIFPFEKLRYIKSVYGTDRTDHPGGIRVRCS